MQFLNKQLHKHTGCRVFFYQIDRERQTEQEQPDV